MHKFILVFLLVPALIFYSHIDRSALSGDKLLLSSSGSFIMEDGAKADGYYRNRDQFIKPYTSVSIAGDTITATTLHDVKACLDATGKISFSNDTIYLLVKEEEGKESCTSTVFKKFTYLIRKPDGKIPVIKF